MTSMKDHVEVIEPRSFPAVVAEEISFVLGEAVADRQRATIALSGGGTPSEVYRVLARPPHVSEVPWKETHFFWGDERYVKREDAASNFRLANETIFANVKEPGENIHPIPVSGTSIEEDAESYHKTIDQLVDKGENGLPRFDLILCGVGKDGHTASLFAGSPLLSASSSKFVAPVVIDGQLPRISLTPEVLCNARSVLVLIRGKEKAAIVQRIFSESESEQQLPAMIFGRPNTKVRWFLDSAAAVNI